MEYTKGDWEAMDSGHVVVGNGFSMKVIANCLARPEAEANAHLIAAAPNTAEACARYDLAIGKAIMAYYQDEPMDKIVTKILLPAQEQGRKALSKAEGGE